MKELGETLRAVFQALSIPEPFLIKRHQCLVVFMSTRLRSVVVEFTTNEARDVVLSKSELLGYSNLHFVGIVLDTPSPRKHQVGYTSKPKRQCFVVSKSQPGAEKPIHRSQGTSIKHLTKDVQPYLQALTLKKTLQP